MKKILIVPMASMILMHAQDRFEEIIVPHFGPYFSVWEKRAKAGDPIAMLELYEWSSGGYSANTDLPLSPIPLCVSWQPNAEKLIKQKVKELADAGNIEAMCRMAFFAVNNPESMTYLIKAAEMGDPFAIQRLGVTYKYKDPRQRELFVKADGMFLERAIAGNKRAMLEIARKDASLSTGESIRAEIIHKLLQYGDFYSGIAYYLRGISALHGGMRAMSPKERELIVLESLEQSARCGEVRGMLQLSQIYYYGGDADGSIITPKNIERAWYWMREYRLAVGCPSPDVDPPKGEHGKPWKRPLRPKIIASEK